MARDSHLNHCHRRTAGLALLVVTALSSALVATRPAGAAEAASSNGTAFVENFEHGLGQWMNPGSALITRVTAAQGRKSVTLTSSVCGGDAFTRLIPVKPGAKYLLHTAYLTNGGGGYIGVSLYDRTRTEVGEQWLIGDGGFPTFADVRWAYNVDRQRPTDLHRWARYSAEYPIPDGIAFVSVKIEDWGCGGLPDDPQGAGVFFDAIKWTRECSAPPRDEKRWRAVNCPIGER